MLTFKNILVVRADRMGDVVLTVPAIRALKKAFPAACVSVWLDPSTRPLLQGLPFIDEILCEDQGRGWPGYFAFIAMLRRRQFDLAVVFHTKRRTNAACALAGIPLRLGYKNNKNGWLLTRPVEDRRHLGEKHETEYCLDLLQSVGVHSTDLSLELARDPAADTWARDFVATELAGDPFLAIHPDASCDTRLWPASSYARLINSLRGRGLKIVLVGRKEAGDCARDICQQVSYPVVDMTAKTSLAQLVSLFRLARAVISNDSGPVHVAAAAGAPIVSIFLRRQPGINPERWKPLGPNTRIVLPPPGQEVRVDRHSRVISGSFDAITPENVLNALNDILP